MKKALEDAGITSGKIGIINVNAATDSCVNREEGFRAAFDGTDFEIAGYTEEDVASKFGALYNAFKFGAPPHAGMAPGVDRMIMMLTGE